MSESGFALVSALELYLQLLTLRSQFHQAVLISNTKKFGKKLRRTSLMWYKTETHGMV